jgi:uncharacterized protein (TIGR03435 family)
MGNHLWQSTFCLVIAGLLTLVLRKNRARVRYGLWLAASVKFLIPFSLLIAIGSHLAKPRVVPATQPGFFYAMEQASQPFRPPAARVIPPVVHSTTLANLLPAIQVAMWFCGCVMVLSMWYARWRRISAALREAGPLREGREVDALRRAERMLGIRKPIDLLMSPATLEPGIFGIVKPALVWPKGISARLDNAQLEAILAHELLHVRRRDNLAAAVHMVVEALFWFHPLVWWLGPRLVEERERACDEEVMESGSDKQVYAESILKTCEFCVESPLACVSGVTGSDLKKRIVRIMTERMANKLSFSRKLLLAGVGIAAVAGPFIFGLVNTLQIRAQSTQTTSAPMPSFEAASVKPNRSGDGRHGGTGMWPSEWTLTNVTTKYLIELAYNDNLAGALLRDELLLGGPSWVNSEKYDVDAKVEASLAGKLRKLSPEQQEAQLSLMVQSLLTDRFKLKVSHESKEFPIYALVVAKGGPKFLPTRFTPSGLPGADLKGPGGKPLPPAPAGKQRFWLHGDMRHLAMLLSRIPDIGRLVLDQTGIKGNYDCVFEWAQDQSQESIHAGILNGSEDGKPATDNAPSPESPGPSIFTAIQEQLGLKLESTTGPVEVLVIDHVERPSEN